MKKDTREVVYYCHETNWICGTCPTFEYGDLPLALQERVGEYQGQLSFTFRDLQSVGLDVEGACFAGVPQGEQCIVPA